MLKTAILMILMLSINACAQSAPILSKTTIKSELSNDTQKTYDETKFRPIIDTLIKMYKKQQFVYNRDHVGSTYVFKIIPITLYPLFCVDVVPSKKTDVIYIYNVSYSVFRTKDAMGKDNIQVGVESYIQGRGCPSIKTYRLHFFFYNVASSQWEEENKAKDIILELTNQAECIYGCRSVK